MTNYSKTIDLNGPLRLRNPDYKLIVRPKAGQDFAGTGSSGSVVDTIGIITYVEWDNDGRARKLPPDYDLISIEYDVAGALQSALEFVCMTIAFIGRDQGTNRIDDTLDGLAARAIAIEPMLRKMRNEQLLPKPTVSDDRDRDLIERGDAILAISPMTEWPSDTPVLRQCAEAIRSIPAKQIFTKRRSK